MPASEPKLHDAREFSSREQAIAFLQSMPVSPDSIIIITPPPPPHG